MKEKEHKLPFFYGWVVVACCFICCFSYGLFYSMGVFFTTLQKEFGWSSALTSSIHSLHLIVFALSSFFMGWLSDKCGPRLPILLGAIFFGVGFSLLGRINNLLQFYLVYVFASLGAGIVWSLPTATVNKWFVERPGLALGIVVAGVGVATFVYSPLARYLIDNYGWRIAYTQMGTGTAMLLLLASLGACTPEKKGIKHYVVGSLLQREVVQRKIREESWSLGEALTNKTLWIFCALSFCTILPIQMIAVHLVPFAESIGIEKATAAWAWGAVGGISILGRIITPTFLEKSIGWRRGLVGVCAILATSFFWISLATNLWMFSLFVVIYGFFYGGKVTLIPALMGSYFGTESIGQLIGFVYATPLIGGALGPLLAGYIVDITGNYIMAFLLGAVFWVVAAFLSWLIRPPKRQKPVTIGNNQ